MRTVGKKGFFVPAPCENKKDGDLKGSLRKEKEEKGRKGSIPWRRQPAVVGPPLQKKKKKRLCRKRKGESFSQQQQSAVIQVTYAQ